MYDKDADRIDRHFVVCYCLLLTGIASKIILVMTVLLVIVIK